MAVVSPGAGAATAFQAALTPHSPMPLQDCPRSHRDCPSRGGAQGSARLTPWGHCLGPQWALGVAMGRQPHPSGRTA